ncbi:MAG: hypothetical protein FJW20_17260 [Acidimicrobiia bacterium]|nr:hypothetical protein [Acidimicrobiia bacterium]
MKTPHAGRTLEALAELDEALRRMSQIRPDTAATDAQLMRIRWLTLKLPRRLLSTYRCRRTHSCIRANHK